MSFGSLVSLRAGIVLDYKLLSMEMFMDLFAFCSVLRCFF